ncbi:hypothetical protein [Methanobacterium oryzae]|uniref:hypothetical protein n=1 Tax=Methanobacterium oryzae TaxID=69540 RepID=UPI003D23B6B5
MLQFEEIKEVNMDGINIEPIEDSEISIPRSFTLVYTDDELTEKVIPEVWEKLNEHNFEGDAENIDFIIYFDDLSKKSKIVMALYYSEDDSNIPKINDIANQYQPIFEDFYNENKPY